MIHLCAFLYGIQKFRSFIWWRGRDKAVQMTHVRLRRPIMKNCHHLLRVQWIESTLCTFFHLESLFFVVSLPNFSVCCSFFLKQLSVLLPKNLLLKMNNCLFYHARHTATLWHSLHSVKGWSTFSSSTEALTDGWWKLHTPLMLLLLYSSTQLQ